MKILLILSTAALLAACASQAPLAIRDAPPESPAIGAVRDDVDHHVGTEVRWGGTIAEVDNREDETWIEIVGRDLRDTGRPISEDSSQGRFLAKFDGFLDPAIYSEGRLLTVVGAIEGRQMQPIGDYDYYYPVVDVESHYLWEEISHRYAYDPYWRYPYYSPFLYDPFYPGIWPYRPYYGW